MAEIVRTAFSYGSQTIGEDSGICRQRDKVSTRRRFEARGVESVLHTGPSIGLCWKEHVQHWEFHSTSHVCYRYLKRKDVLYR